MIRILVADDHIVVREGVKQILSNLEDIVVEDEAGDGQEALEKALRGDFDVVLLDISMPGRGGLETLEDILKHKPRLPVLILSMHPEEQYAVRALRSGASGYLTKASAPQELIGAIRKVARGASTSLRPLPKNWPSNSIQARRSCGMKRSRIASTRSC